MIYTLCAASFAFSPVSLAPQRSAISHARAVPTMNFFDDLQANLKSMMTPPPSLDEAFEMCRDEESNGCTVDMLDALEKNGAQLAKKQAMDAVPKYTWSAEIDDAVVKPE